MTIKELREITNLSDVDVAVLNTDARYIFKLPEYAKVEHFQNFQKACKAIGINAIAVSSDVKIYEVEHE